MPDLMGFLLYCAENANFKKDYLGASKKSAFINNSVIKLLEWFRKGAKQALKKASVLHRLLRFRKLQTLPKI